MFNVSFVQFSKVSCIDLKYHFNFQLADKAKVIYAPTEIYLPYGRPATLDCHFRSNPPLTNLRWEKDGFLFDPYNVQVTLTTITFIRYNSEEYKTMKSHLSFTRESFIDEMEVYSLMQSMNHMLAAIHAHHIMSLVLKVPLR